MDRQEKERTVADLQGRFAKATAAVLTEYRGLTVAEFNALRRELREVGGEYRVAKNTLVELAIEGSPYLSLKDLLAGQNGLVFGYGDAMGLAKVVARYAREHDKFTIKGGVTDGQFLAAAGVEAIALLPSREALRAQLLGLLSRPAAQLVSVLAAPAGRLARVLDARKTQLSTT
ncbi:MAG: 50S ribosomal protein L10 [Deltaproteobacteria bacterium]|nr:50S ribosomal protein L10 [Deltaproteobacteria bacterium]